MHLTAEDRDRILASLRDVGPSKAIGYHPRYTIIDLLGLSESAVIAEANSRGLAGISLGPDLCRIKSGALYVYDRAALGQLLAASAPILSFHNLPTDPDEFVRVVAETWFDESHPAHAIIAEAFGQGA